MNPQIKLTIIIFIFCFISEICVYAVELNYEPVVSGYPSANNLQFGDVDLDGVMDAWYTWYSYALRGGSQTGFDLFKGSGDGHFEAWDNWYWSAPPKKCPVLGDWLTGGSNEFLFFGYNVSPRIILLNRGEFGEKKGTLHLSDTSDPIPYDPYSYRLLGKGDFDGDGFDDALFTYYSSEEACLYGDGAANFELMVYKNSFDYDSNNGAVMAILDINKDNYDDWIARKSSAIISFYGNANRETVFSASKTIDLDFLASKIIPVELYPNNPVDLYIPSATQYQYLRNDGEGNLRKTDISFPPSWNPPNAHFADLDMDSKVECLTWRDGILYIYQQNEMQSFSLLKEIALPYVKRIDTVYVTDMNQDGINDILLFSSIHAAITLLNQPNKPSPTPTIISNSPTPTPPIQFSTPTPSPYPIDSNAIVLSPDDNAVEIINNAPSGSKIIFEPGSYSFEPSSQSGIAWDYCIENKEITLIGREPSRSTKISGIFTIKNASFTMQNIVFLPFIECYTGINAENSNLLFINNYIEAAYRYIKVSAGQQFPGGPAIHYSNADGKTITLIQNTIEYGSTGNSILLSNCNDCLIDMQDNSSLGKNNGKSAIDIENCTNIQLFLSPTDTYDRFSLTHLKAKYSILDIYNGVIHGIHGQDEVLGFDGAEAIYAINNSHVTLHNTQLYGGLGGNGIQPGKDAPPYVTDESSIVYWTTAVQSWLLMQ